MSPLRSAPASTGTARRVRAAVVDEACAAAVDLALDAAEQTAWPSKVGEHLSVVSEGDRVATHYFAGVDHGYRGWHWAVTVARASRAKNVTVSEVSLLPGEEAVMPPAWVPWLERLRPGDMGPGDLLPTADDDERLTAGFTQPDDATDRQAVWELGLGRARVLSPEGRDQAAERWYEGTAGPHTPIATSAPAQCSTCGFFIPLAGDLRQLFGVCANAYVPDDGKVVAVDHGCGGHSEAVVIPSQSESSPLIIDEFNYDLVPISSLDDDEESSSGHS
ncbi:MAG: DUF3027 domain-containing protein [Streptosporangiaceae bacterium]